MTSPYATNHKFNELGKTRYLEVNKEGQPLQGQVPLTYQVYNDGGNETIAYDGSDVFVVSSTLPAGKLTVDFSEMNNWCGRSVQFIAYLTLLHDIDLDFGTGLVYFPPFTVVLIW